VRLPGEGLEDPSPGGFSITERSVKSDHLVHLRDINYKLYTLYDTIV
jgi:hypothetical protein